MSALDGIAFGGGRRSLNAPGPVGRARLERSTEVERPVAMLVTFGALAIYGVSRWEALLSPAPGWRLFGLLALAVLVAGAGPRLAARSRAVAIVAAVCSVLAMLMISGIPLSWLLGLRISVISQGIGQGISALPGVLLPYVGINDWVRLVIVLGAGVLLLDAALVIAFAPRTLGDLRRSGAALPLVALAVIPSTLERPQLPYVQGLILFALIAAFMWSERLAPRYVTKAVAVAGVAGVCGVVLAPRLEAHHPWINYEALAGSLSQKNVDTFNWSQTYGPLTWPQRGRAVLEVTAQHPDYWKTENLDVFNGLAWAQGTGVVGSQVPRPAEWALKRFTQTIRVTIRQMQTTDVIAAGTAAQPDHVGEGVIPGISSGTWTTAGSPLTPGDAYTVTTYSPRPDAAQLAADASSENLADYPSNVFADDLTIALPTNGLTIGQATEVEFPAFGSGALVQNLIGPYNASGGQLVDSSPYARAYALATTLARRSANPYAFVQSVERYLSTANGFRYDLNPPLRTYPLESFLFSDKRGYCQQFAGAMALLLRMGGVPARVVTGFTTGQYNSKTKQYVVDDTDAHAWVEAWFANYGWVRFDPTPAAPSTVGGPPSLPAQSVSKGASANSHARLNASSAGSGATRAGSHHAGSAIWIALGALAALLTLAAVALRAARRSEPPTGEQLVAELERALARSGRPLAAGTTLAALERRFHTTADAEGYVRALRLARFAGAGALPSVPERRALRGELAAGLGFVGRLRAWWALPPRFLH